MTVQKPFRFGVVSEGAPSRAEWVAKARRAEAVGYATLHVPDHFVTEFSPAIALLAAADVTSTLRVGSFVFDNDFRHPVVLAKDAATLDVLTDGRLELGIGGGWHLQEYEQAGIPFDPPGVRINRLEESLCIIKGFFADEPVNFAGKYYTVTGLNGLPKSIQKPHPPVFIGGGGQRVLTVAAREANIIGIHYKINKQGKVDWEERTGAALARKIEWIRQAAEARFDELEFNLLIGHVRITDDKQPMVERLIREREWTDVTVEQVLESPYLFFGTVEEVVEKVQMLRELYNVSYVTVGDDALDDFAPVVSQLAGT